MHVEPFRHWRSCVVLGFERAGFSYVHCDLHIFDGVFVCGFEGVDLLLVTLAVTKCNIYILT